MSDVFNQGIAVGTTDTYMLTANTASFEIMNMTQYDLIINASNLNGFRLPTFSGKTFEAGQAADTLNFKLVDALISVNNGLSTNDQYVQISQSSVPGVSPIQPFVSLSVYSTSISGTVDASITNQSVGVQVQNASVPVSGSVGISGTNNTVQIGNTPNVNATIKNASIPVTQASGSTFNANITNANVPISGNVGVTTGNVNATIQNATLDTNTTNAFVSSNDLVLIYDGTASIVNLAAGADTSQLGGTTTASTGAGSPQFGGNLDGSPGFFDGFVLVLSSANVLASDYEVILAGNGLFYNANLSPNQAPTMRNQATTEYNITVGTFTDAFIADGFYFYLKNVSASTIVSDTISYSCYGIRATVNVANNSSQPVPTIPQAYYGTGADGAFNPTSNYTFQNTSNTPDVKNYTSINIPSGVTVSWANSAHYVCWFVEGDVTIAGVINAPLATANISPSQPAITLFNKNITVPAGGNGGQGGAGGNGNGNGGTGASGGTASPYGSGAGGGGGGGQGGAGGVAPSSSNGIAGNNGNGTTSGGTAGTGANGGSAGTNGQTITVTLGTATLIIIASGKITITGAIDAQGTQGGQGGQGGNASGANSVGGGGAGGAGAGNGGTGGNGENGNAGVNDGNSHSGSGGGGGGGNGGAAVLLYSGSTISITGTVNINAGIGGNPGIAGTSSGGTSQINGTTGTAGNNGQAGTLTLYQYNNQIAG